MPWSALTTQKRDVSVAGGSTGGYLVATDMLDAIDTLRPWSVSVRAGISIVPGLKGNTTFPKTSVNATAYWLTSESTSVTPSTPTVGQMALVPRTAGALVNVSRLLLTQVPQTEIYLRRELLRTIGTAVDHAVLNGAGSNEPVGVLNAAGIGTTSGTSLAWAAVTGMQKTVAEANGDDGVVSFIATPAVRALLATRERATGSGFVWDSGRVDHLTWPRSKWFACAL